MRPSFELDEQIVVPGRRLELHGRWSNVRGMRFVRPALILADGGELLADLEHKPWTASDGEPWVVAFAWPYDDFDPRGVILAPAPSIEAPLAPPMEGGDVVAGSPPRAALAEGAAAVAVPPADAAGGRRVPAAGAATIDVRSGDGERDRLRRDLTRERERNARVIGERDAARAELAVARERASELQRQLEEARARARERAEQMTEALGQRDATAREREALSARLDAAAAAGERSRAEHAGAAGKLSRELEQARAETATVRDELTEVRARIADLEDERDGALERAEMVASQLAQERSHEDLAGGELAAYRARLAAAPRRAWVAWVVLVVALIALVGLGLSLFHVL